MQKIKEVPMTIQEFKESRDYRDIMYMIKHVPYATTRCSILKELGYKVAIDFPKDKETLRGTVYVKSNKLKMQVTNKIKGQKYFWCVVL